jgi:type I restriction enzyme, S subunit
MELKPVFKRTVAGLVPEDWDVSVIADLAETSSGTTPPRAMHDRYFKNGAHAWVKTMDLNNAAITSTSELVTDLALKETSLRIYPIGTVLVAMYGGLQQIGRTGLLRVPAAVNQAITAIRAKKEELVPEYLLVTLNYRVEYWRSVASSSRKDPNISSQDVRKFPIGYPRPVEQRAIAEALGDVDALLEALERLIAKKRDIKQAAMQQLLTGRTRLPGFTGEWGLDRLGDVLKVRHGRSQRGIVAQSGQYAILASGGEIGRTDSFIYDKPSVLIDRKGTIDSPQYLDVPFWAVDTLFYTEISAMVDAKFLYYRFALIHWRGFNEASGVPSLNAKTIESIAVEFPELLEQKAIAKVLSDMDAEITALEQRLEKTRALKQGMMQELLTGRIRLGPKEESANHA